jgi:hypothetical protein
MRFTIKFNGKTAEGVHCVAAKISQGQATADGLVPLGALAFFAEDRSMTRLRVAVANPETYGQPERTYTADELSSAQLDPSIQAIRTRLFTASLTAR